MKAVLDAHRQKEVLEIDIQKDILKKEGEKKLSELENEIVKLREQVTRPLFELALLEKLVEP
jgi:hypothetical protein